MRKAPTIRPTSVWSLILYTGQTRGSLSGLECVLLLMESDEVENLSLIKVNKLVHFAVYSRLVKTVDRVPPLLGHSHESYCWPLGLKNPKTQTSSDQTRRPDTPRKKQVFFELFFALSSKSKQPLLRSRNVEGSAILHNLCSVKT